jgi:phytoene dehydrogenase-like protein
MLARAGVETTLLEAQSSIGGGVRSAELTLPGFVHDICSAVHPLAVSSPAFASLPLAEHGLKWIQPPAPVAHPLDGGRAVLVDGLLEQTAQRLGKDGAAYRRAIAPLVSRWKELTADILGPIRWPTHPGLLARFCALAPWPATLTARAMFRQPETRAMFAGMAGHSVLPLENIGSGVFGWVLAISAHAVGWPIPRGGSQIIANALASFFESLGGRIVRDTPVRSLDELKDAGTILCDLTPRQLVHIAANRLPERYCRKLERYRYGPGVFKMDWALNGPIPWAASECAQAATVHVGGTLEEIADSERAAWEGRVHHRPFILLAQPSLFDSSRAPEGKHTAWAYCHVPNGCPENMEERIESQIERFAPGFRGMILARHASGPADLEQHNANLVGGDITGGAQDARQLILRPTRHFYRTPDKNLFICSSSTPPGAGVHGMCGYHAALAALKDRAQSS